MSELFIEPQYLEILKDIFDNYCPKAEIWAYGSRIKGEAHSGSDLDLVVKSFNCESANLYKLRELISDSNIPFIVDIHEFNQLPKSFQDEIKQNYEVIYNNY